MEPMEFLHTSYGMIFLAVIGMFTHFLKKKIRGESAIAIKKYFSNHFRSTLLAFICTIVCTWLYQSKMAEGGMADLLVVFFGGYNFDSFLNDHSQKKV